MDIITLLVGIVVFLLLKWVFRIIFILLFVKIIQRLVTEIKENVTNTLKGEEEKEDANM